MLSKTLIAAFTQAETIPQPLELQDSLSKLKTKVEALAVRQACLRCSKAGYMLNVDIERRGWGITQVKCDDYRALPPHTHGFGIGFACEPEVIYTCDEEAGGGIGDDPPEGLDQRQRGFAEAERDQAKPEIQRSR